MTEGSQKLKVLGEELLKRIHIHNPDYGGVLTETTGAQGSAKTSVLLAFTDYTLKHYPKEKIFWSEQYNAPLQIFKLGKSKYQFFVKKDSNVIFRDRDKKLEPKNLYEKTFDSFDDLYERAILGKVNVVFFGDRLKWMEFLHYLREVGEWTHVYIDEIGEIAPMFSSGRIWKRINGFSNDLGAVRRCMMNVHYNTQSISDIDYRVRTKVMIKVFLPGARADSNSRVTQRAIDNLERHSSKGNQAYLDMGGQFGLTRFENIYRPMVGKHIEAHVWKEDKID